MSVNILISQKHRIKLEVEKTKQKLKQLEELQIKIENKLCKECDHDWIRDRGVTFDDLGGTSCSRCGINYLQVR
tara:strand:+ start:296 stop:517 length:222 start_codon:yes stop_codon:yes gene_type:complete